MAPVDCTPSRDKGGRGGGGGSGGELADEAGATSSIDGIAGDPNVVSLLFAAGGAATCLRH